LLYLTLIMFSLQFIFVELFMEVQKVLKLARRFSRAHCKENIAFIIEIF
jgi:hypothetical protein